MNTYGSSRCGFERLGGDFTIKRDGHNKSIGRGPNRATLQPSLENFQFLAKHGIFYYEVFSGSEQSGK